MAGMDIAEANFFFRDYVTEDIVSYGIGQVWLYHYKETLIGVRNIDGKIAYFADIATVPKTDSPYAPTLDQLTDKHIKEAIDEIDRGDEKLEYIPITELVGKGKEMIAAIISADLDKKLLGGN